ncbi:hypothetical protein V7122_02585 [Bacillus sp. JJ1532]|uniref:hypothetical protein n=1 Tax=Bacillus sp. JJ1532 TaxID=3122958 RepID=UPI002FFDC423
MPTKTTNFNLIKPGQDEFYNVNDQNANMDTIDEALKTLQEAISSGATEQELEQIRQDIATHLAEKASPTKLGHVKAETDEEGNLILPEMSASNVTTISGGNVQTEIDNLKQYGNDGKNLLETTLISKKAKVSKVGEYATFTELDTAIKQLRDAATITYFYNEGDEKETLTGGWVTGYSLGTGTQSKQANHLFIDADKYTSNNNERTYVTNLAIDLSNIKNLFFDAEKFSGHQSIFTVSKNKTTSWSDNSGIVASLGVSAPSDPRKVFSLDVGSLSGNYYIKLSSASSSAVASGDAITKVYRVWGEE